MISEVHFKVFEDLFALQGHDWLGHNVFEWATYVAEKCPYPPTDVLSTLPRKKVSRSELFEMQESSHVDDLSLTIAVLAWGGMNRTHGIKALATWEQWGHLIAELRTGSITRSAAYAEFKKIRANGTLNGMGPAYFTKLIFFSHPAHDGFIMDQWTARSSNLLGLSPVVEMYSTLLPSGRRFMGVSDKNTPEHYEKFCQFLEVLADKSRRAQAASEIEEAMFSLGRGKGAWRNYVMAKT